MSNFTRVFTTALLLLGVTMTASADLACDAGQIALGTHFQHYSVHNQGAVFDSSCSMLDWKSNLTDDSVCGDYSEGSEVSCDTADIPQSGVLPNGTAFGNCVSNVHDCDNIEKVEYCCSIF